MTIIIIITVTDMVWQMCQSSNSIGPKTEHVELIMKIIRQI